MSKPIYVVNIHGHFFSVERDIPLDREAMKSCTFFTTQQGMFQFLLNMGCAPEMLDAGGINRIERHGDKILCVDDRAEESLGDMSVEQYIADWEL